MSEERQELTRCKYCGEIIPAESLRCPACGERLKYDLKKLSYISAITFIVVLLGTTAILGIKTPRKVDLPKENQSLVEQGIDLFEDGKYSDAEDMFNKAISENKDPKAYYYLGQIKEKNGDNEDAIYNYQESLRLDPLNKKLKPYLVNLCITEGDNECVDEFIAEAYNEDPFNSKIALQYALSYSLSQEESFNILRKIPSTSTDEYYYANKIMGFHYAHYNEYKTAIPYLQKAYKLRGKAVENSIAENFITEKYSSSDINEGAVLVGCYAQLEQYTNAIKILDELIAKGGDPELISLRERIISARDNYNAQKAYEKQQQQYQRQYEQQYQQSNYRSNNYGNTSTSSSAKPKSPFTTPNTTINGVKLKSKIVGAGGDWGYYMRDIETRVKRNWNEYKADYSYRTVVSFKIDRSGSLVSRTVTQSSGIPAADRAATNAIELTAPFKPLPSWFDGETITINFNFDYNVKNSVLN